MTSTRRLISGGLIAFTLLIFSQYRVIGELWGAWQTEEYSHGILIPFVALLLGWHRLAEVRPELRPSWWGVALLAAAGVLQLAAKLSAFETLAEYGLILGITGLCFGFLGCKAVRAIAPALVYLLFAVPLPHIVQADLSEDMQLISSSFGVGLLELIGVPVFQQGNIIDLGSFRLQVIEACNGLRYLFPLMSFGYVIAFLLQDRWWKRVVIFISTIPIAIFFNALRIAFVGVTVDLWGVQMAEGFLHSFEGWSVFMLCLTVLMGEVWALRTIGARGRFRYDYLGLTRGDIFGGASGSEKPAVAALLLAAILGFVFGSDAINLRDEMTPPHPAFAAFPLSLGTWRGHAASLEPDVLQALQLSDYWMADYRTSDKSAAVNLYIAYYASQRAGAQTHSPSNCIPGGGWQIETSDVVTMTPAPGAKLKLTRLLIRRGEAAEVVYYWFDERGRDLTDTGAAKWYLLWDSIFMHRTDGALIRLVTPLATSESETAGEARLDDFLGTVWGQIGVFVPGPPEGTKRGP